MPVPPRNKEFVPSRRWHRRGANRGRDEVSQTVGRPEGWKLSVPSMVLKSLPSAELVPRLWWRRDEASQAPSRLGGWELSAPSVVLKHLPRRTRKVVGRGRAPSPALRSPGSGELSAPSVVLKSLWAPDQPRGGGVGNLRSVPRRAEGR